MKKKKIILLIVLFILILYFGIVIYFAWKGGYFEAREIFNFCNPPIPSNLTIIP